jgi:hypothetical protein
MSIGALENEEAAIETMPTVLDQAPKLADFLHNVPQ